MNNMRLPTRRAPTIEDARRTQSNKNQLGKKKTPPPRPPPPNFAKAKSKSAWNLNQNDNTISLIEWSPPNSPKANDYNSHAQFNGSISSSFSSSTSSLASSKKSFECENSNDWIQVASSTFYQKSPGYTVIDNNNGNAGGTASSKPTIIRAAPPKKAKMLRPTSSASTSREVSPLPPYFQSSTLLIPVPVNTQKDCDNSPPMPNIPPPSPPKNVRDVIVPFGIALYDYNNGQEGDLQFLVNDVIYLTRHINDDWLMGKTVDDREGMFPRGFVDIQVPLANENVANLTMRVVTAIYDFVPQVQGDLSFKTGDSIKVLRIIDNNWLEGECNGRIGQFPVNFVNGIPWNIK